MIYVGENEITNIYIGTNEIYGIYAGDLQIYPTDFGSVTGLSLENLTWVTDVPASGGTADSGNCSFDVYAYYDSGKRRKVNRDAVISGSLVVPATTATTREMVGTLTLTATYSGFTDSDSVDVYQKEQTYNNMLVYTTTDGNALNRDFSQYAWAQNYVSHTYSGGEGRIVFDNDLTTIPQSTFSGCTTLQTISIPITVTSYGASAFTECSGMTAFTISSAITSIGQGCFYLASGELTIDGCQYAVSGNGSGMSYTDNWTYSFNYRFCDSSDYNTRKNFFTKIVIDNVVYIGKSAFNQNIRSQQSNVTEVIIGNNVEEISGMAFRSCNGLEKLTVGSGLKRLGSYAFFAGPESLTRQYWYPVNSPTLGGNINNTFQYCHNQATDEFHYPTNGSGYTAWKTNYLSNWQFINDL